MYEPSPKGFEHLIQASVVDPEGKVIHQVYGMDFDTPLLVEPLKRLVFSVDEDSDMLTTISNKARYYGPVYEQSSDTYRFKSSIFVKFLVDGVVMLFFGVQLVKEWRKAFRSE